MLTDAALIHLKPKEWVAGGHQRCRSRDRGRRAACHYRPERRRQDQPDEPVGRPVGAQRGTDSAQGPGHHRRAAGAHLPPGVGADLPEEQSVPQPLRPGECPPGGAGQTRRRLEPLRAGVPAAGPRAPRRGGAHRGASHARRRRAGACAVLRRAAPVGNCRGAGGRPRSAAARRADLGHVAGRNQADDRADRRPAAQPHRADDRARHGGGVRHRRPHHRALLRCRAGHRHAGGAAPQRARA